MSEQKIKRHPIRGFLYGIVFGLGLAMLAVGQKWAALGTWPPFILFVVGIVVGTVWSTFGPAKGPKGGAPPEAAPEPDPEPEPEPEPTYEEPPAEPAPEPTDSADITTGETPAVDEVNEPG